MSLHSHADLLRDSLVPSYAGGFVCILAGIFTVGIGVLRTAALQGTPDSSAQAGSQAPTIDRLLTRGSWSDVVSICMQLLVLVLVFGVIDFLLGGYARLRGESHREGEETAHIPESRWLLERACWRFGVGLVAIVGGFLLIQPIHWVSTTEQAQVDFIQMAAPDAVWAMAIACLIWAITYYFVIVCIRLFIFRSRLLHRRYITSSGRNT